MKARVKATGENIEVIRKQVTSIFGHEAIKYIDQKTGVSYFEEELCFPKDLTNYPDYWTRLEHQYAGMAMQGILSCPEWNIVPRKGVSHAQECALQAQEFAHALVEKLKEKEEK